MKNNKYTGEYIKNQGFSEGKIIGELLDALDSLKDEMSESEVDYILTDLKNDPVKYLSDNRFKSSAEELLKPVDLVLQLKDTPDPYKVYGADGIEEGALKQMEIAMRLPIARTGALMADAHQGYGLPIGGVLATENSIIPYGVGVDIGCRMCMSIYEISDTVIEERKNDLKKMLIDNARFGRETFKKPKDHQILDSNLFKEIDVIRKLKDKAASQIGSSGGGNHFVEFGVTTINSPDNELNLAEGRYLAVLSHSGSRGMGAAIANHYTKLAMSKCDLPKEAKHLAWLDLDTEEGQEYWLAMNLAGDYASACHHQIHERMAVGLRANPIAMIENHHNFAWKEQDDFGNEIIVHRKGATPAGKGVLGIIPGTMTEPGFIVRGKGNSTSVNSASHGAGRVMSRTRAKNTLDAKSVSNYITNAGVEVIGSGLDEAPMAYKNIHDVMDAQKDLVDIIGTFQPRIVRMCGDKKFKEVD
ncbi:RtcB family protein [Mangrovivirga sp. M17]|uniref:3'-phosphate/5'-hydroxy nucleic acid ligase n=1 Tax=Mangrovivirga halotolerans TaxID=2993936 RepID=A0ABT3RQW6_9BACT|nr:RtcB family protein [Mangrovivirga halotolerans]MCX2744164.1 RtcB family protein [Mangrovivirga halotolerans]